MQPDPRSPDAVVAREITIAYGDRRALDSFSLRVPEGATFGLLGPNGSGKSTFMTLLAAMAPPPSGTIEVFGRPPASALRARVGVVFQENTADPLMTVAETLSLAGRLYGLARADIARRAAELLGLFGLAARRDSAVSTLSGGMRRRLEMARALLHGPDLLLLDEPTTGVDPSERRALWEALKSNEQRKTTILLATNDLAEADAVCDRVAFLREGKIVATGAPNDLKRSLRREAVHVTWPAVTAAQLQAVAGWPGVGEPSLDGGDILVTVDDASAFIPRLFEFAPSQVRAVRIEASSLEDAYFQHVGRRAGEPRR